TGPITIPLFSQLPQFGAPPGAITNLTAAAEVVTQNDKSKITNVILSWTPPTPSPTTGFYKDALVEYSLGASGPWTTLGYGVRDFRWQNAPHGVTLYFRVTPRGSNLVFNYSGSATTSLAVPWFNTPLAAVTGLVGTISNDSAVWTWNDLDRSYQ